MTISVRQRRLIHELAGGCCEYCRLGRGEQSAKFHIDHIIAIKHGGEDMNQNLCLACLDCNLKKGANVAALDPLDGKPTTLFHPRLQVWNEHFQIEDDASVMGITPEGRTTVSVLGINSEIRRRQRYKEMLLGNYPCQNKP